MKKFSLTFLMTLCMSLCHGEITQVNDMEEVFALFDNADSKTLAIFDVDMVLVQPSDSAFQMANMKRFSSIAKRIMKEVPIPIEYHGFHYLGAQTYPSKTITEKEFEARWQTLAFQVGALK